MSTENDPTASGASPSPAPRPTHCSKCGEQLAAGATFCGRCGDNVTQQLAAYSPPPGAATDPAIVRLESAVAGRYSIIREIGRGGMATVYLAKDLKHERDVAIKVLHPDLAASIGGDRFEREIRLVANLRHPNILTLYDSGASGGLVYYVMPFVEGESLRSRMDRDGQFPLDDAIRIALEVANALGYAHKRGIIHRDIKPENILLEGEHTVVADFGIARAVTEAAESKLTQTGMAMGTPLYMSPEQAAGEAAGPSADIYSLGCVLYEMLAGEPPFTGKSPMAIMARHAMEQVPSLRIVRSAVPEEVEEAIYRAMGKVPADRPQTAAQFAELMGLPLSSTATISARSLAGRRTLSGQQPGFTEKPRTSPPWQRTALVAAAGLAIGVAAVAGLRWANDRRAATTLGPDAHRIAVLYFQDQSSDHRLSALADGLTEGLIRTLSTAPSLTVISRSGVEKYRGSNLAPDSVARALRAGYLVRGEVEPEGGGNQVRVSVRLDDQSGVNLRRASFVRSASNLPGIQDTLVVVVADLIKQQLREEILLREQRVSTGSADAWLLLQRGEQARKSAEAFAAKGDVEATNRSFAAADSLLSLAQGKDLRWADPPLLRGAVAYRRSRLVGRDLPTIRSWVDVGLQHVARAFPLDPDNADAFELRGNLRYWSWLVGLESDPAKAKALLYSAKEDFEKATALNPRQAGAYASLSHLYYQTSTSTDVNIAAQRALEADEFLANADVILSRLFLSSYDLGQFDKADQWCGRVRERFPLSVFAVRCQLYLLTARTKQADVPAAWRLADSMVALAPAPARPLQQLTAQMLVAAVIARASRTQPALADSARRVARRSIGEPSLDPTRDLTFSGAFVFNLLGDKTEALRLLKEYVAANPNRVQALRNDPGWWFRDLESDPEFTRLVGAAN